VLQGHLKKASQVHTRLRERPRPGHCEKQQSRTVHGILSDAHNKQPAHARSGRPQWCRTGAGSSRIGRSQAGDQGVCHGCRYAPRSATPAAIHCLIELVDEHAMRRSEVARAPAQWVRKVALRGQQRGNSRRRPRRRGICHRRPRGKRCFDCLCPRYYD